MSVSDASGPSPGREQDGKNPAISLKSGSCSDLSKLSVDDSSINTNSTGRHFFIKKQLKNFKKNQRIYRTYYTAGKTSKKPQICKRKSADIFSHRKIFLSSHFIPVHVKYITYKYFINKIFYQPNLDVFACVKAIAIASLSSAVFGCASGNNIDNIL